jgi:hypothetical protein
LTSKPRIVPSAVTGTRMSVNVRSLPCALEATCSERYSVHFAGRPALRLISMQAAIAG